ncbi:MAG: YicC family protein [Deltaproteobacteria bacterium]|nr:YicC family protein [Deltaproteobacteria bacterium]
MQSMTGYGIAEGSVGRGRLFVEVKSINHRFCEVVLKLPPKMGSIEGHMRKWLQERFHRGKIEVYMKEKSSLFGQAEFIVNEELAKGYRESFRKLRKSLGDNGPNDFLQYVDIERFITVIERDGDYERFWRSIERLLTVAAAHVDKMRTAEGRFIERDQRKRLKLLFKLIARIQFIAAKSVDQHVERLRRRMTKESTHLDEEKIQAEAAFLGGRQDIAEELTRLQSHAHQYDKLLSSSGGLGRKLDFLLQEMNREINTIGSKAGDAKISQLVVDCKTELERLREQVQNIE